MKHQKTIAILFPIEDYSTGGVTTFVDQYSTFLGASEFEAIVFGFEGEVERDAGLFQNSTIVSISKSRIPFKMVRRFVDCFKYVITVTKTIYKYNIVQIHFSTTKSTLMTLLSPLSWSKRKTGTFYGDWANEVLSFRNTFNDRTVDFWKRRCVQMMTLHLLNKVIVFSEYAQKLLIKDHKIPGKKIVILPGACTHKEIDFEKTFTSNGLKLLNISRLDPRKGHANLLHAMKLLKDDQNIELIIAGPFGNSEIYNLIQLYEELALFMNVRFVHSVNSRMKDILYRWADLFVMPSLSLETFGMTIIEALSHGVPVIGSNIGAIPEILNKIDSKLVICGTGPQEIMNKIRWYSSLSIQKKNYLRKKCIKAMRVYYSFEVLRSKFLNEIILHLQ